MFSRGRKIDRVRKAIKGIKGVSIHDVYLVHGTDQSPDEKPRFIDVVIPVLRCASTRQEYSNGMAVLAKIDAALEQAGIHSRHTGDGVSIMNDEEA